MASELSSGSTACDWGSLPAGVMGTICSFIDHSPDLPEGTTVSEQDNWTFSDRKSVANARLVCKRWALDMPAGVASVYATGKPPSRSTTMLDSVTRLFWNMTDANPFILATEVFRRRGVLGTLSAPHGTAFTASLPSLEFLRLVLPNGVASVTDIVDALVPHGKLKRLTIEGCFSGSDAVLRDVARLKSLECLKLNALTDAVSDHGFRAMSSLTRLRHLDINGGVQVTDRCLQTVCECLPGLRRLDLHRFESITEAAYSSFTDLAKLGKLEHLFFDGSPLLTEEGFQAFRERMSWASRGRTGVKWCKEARVRV
jgi:hypothetical protein